MNKNEMEKMKKMESLLWRWAPMFCDHDINCAVKDLVGGECNCDRDPLEDKLFRDAIKPIGK